MPTRRSNTSFACPAVGWREARHAQRLHRRKVESANSSIDCRPPKPQPHLQEHGRDNAVVKKDRMEKDMMDLKLFDAMTRIMTRNREPQHGEVDARTSSARGGRSGSLNVEARMREYHRIQQENQKLLSRIQSSKPSVNTKELLRAHSEEGRRLLMNASCTRRQAGGYDEEMAQFRSSQRGLSKSEGGSAPSRPASARPTGKPRPASAQRARAGSPGVAGDAGQAKATQPHAATEGPPGRAATAATHQGSARRPRPSSAPVCRRRLDFERRASGQEPSSTTTPSEGH